MTEDEMLGWHHRLNGYQFEQTLGDSEGHGSLVCCSPWGHKEQEMTQRLNNPPFSPLTEIFNRKILFCSEDLLKSVYYHLYEFC